MLGELAPGGVAEQRTGSWRATGIVEFAGVRVHGRTRPVGAKTYRGRWSSTLPARGRGQRARRWSIDDAALRRGPCPRWLTFADGRRSPRSPRSRSLLGVAAPHAGAPFRDRARRAAARAVEPRRDRVARPATGGTWRRGLRRSCVTLRAGNHAARARVGAELDVPTLFVAWLAARIVLARPGPRGNATKSVRQDPGRLDHRSPRCPVSCRSAPSWWSACTRRRRCASVDVSAAQGWVALARVANAVDVRSRRPRSCS